LSRLVLVRTGYARLTFFGMLLQVVPVYARLGKVKPGQNKFCQMRAG